MGRGASPEIVVVCARAAEERGFASIWQGEHVVLFDDYAPRYPFSPDGIPPLPGYLAYLDPFVALAIAGGVTEQVRLGTGTVILGQRNPVYLAKEAASLDVLTGGRVVLGVGLGWSAEEYAACGVPFARRGARTDEYVKAIRRLWADDVASFQGEFIAFRNARLNPKPYAGDLPIYFGGSGD
jgi:probable F420-dependent oxidoreductase